MPHPRPPCAGQLEARFASASVTSTTVSTGGRSLSRPPGADEERPRIDRLALPPSPASRAHHHLKVEMRLAPIGVAGRADEADHLAAGETGTLDDPVPIRIEVRVVVDEALGLVGGVDREAALAIAMEPEHPTGIGGEDGRSARCEDVDGAVDTDTPAARRTKVVGHLLRRHARDRYPQPP